MSLSVFMLTPSFHPHIGGAERQALEISKALIAKGATVTVLTRRLRGLASRESVQGVPVRRIAAWGPGLVGSLVFMWSSFWHLLLGVRRYQIVHVHLAGSPALAACFAAILTRRRVIVKIGGGRGIGEVAASARTWTGRLKLRTLRCLKPQFVAVARDLAAEMREHGLCEDARVIPNGVDVERFRPADDARRQKIRKKFGWPAGLCFLYVGRLAPEKQLDRFLRAFAETAKGAKAFCVFVGGGTEEGKLRAEIKRLGLGRQARLVGASDDAAPFYAAADVFVLPSVSEGLSNALLEAMSSGLAVLGSRVGGTREAVEEERTGLLFGPNDSDELNTKLNSFLRAPERAAVLGKTARQECIKRFSMDAVADKYLEVYQEGMSPSRA